MHENGHGIIDGEHVPPVSPAPRGHAAAGQQEPADASRLVVRPARGPGSLPARMISDGSDPAWRGGLPSFPAPLARLGSAGLGRQTQTETGENGRWAWYTPHLVLWYTLPSDRVPFLAAPTATPKREKCGTIAAHHAPASGPTSRPVVQVTKWSIERHGPLSRPAVFRVPSSTRPPD